VPEIAVNDYAIVHVGFAIERVDQETAEKTLEVFRKMGVLEEELADGEEAVLMARGGRLRTALMGVARWNR